jgi:nitrogen regulatory protein P-II 2
MTTPLKLLVVVAEEAIAPKIVEDIKRLGATGYTQTDAHGEGARGKRMGRVGETNARIETVVGDAVAERILARLAEHYFPRYAVIAWTSDVAVVRGEKYV